MSSCCCAAEQLSVTVLWMADSKAQDGALHHHSRLTHTHTHTIYTLPGLDVERWRGYPRLSVCVSVGAACCCLYTHKHTPLTVHWCTVSTVARHKCVKWILLSQCWQAGGACPHNSSSAQARGAAVLSSSYPRPANFPRLQTFAPLDVTLGSCGALSKHRSG